jgi:SAM-dependent methyltransferase
MKTETLKTCPSCNSEKIHHLLDVPDYYFSQKTFPINECESCGLRFTQNRPTEEEIGEFYDSSNYASHDSGKKQSLFLKAYQLARNLMLNEKFNLVRQFKPEWKQVLDYGTGEGFFVEFLLNKGKNAFGIEPSEIARNNFKNRTGQTLFPDLTSLPPSSTYQVITLWHVLEHIHKLRPTMEDIVTRLDSKGILVIAVPNQKSKDADFFGKEWAAWDVPRHLYHWDEKSLSNFMQSLGLTKIYTTQLPLDPFYIGMISSKYKGKSPLEGILQGLKSYLHGRQNPAEGSTLLTVWMKN